VSPYRWRGVGTDASGGCLHLFASRHNNLLLNNDALLRNRHGLNVIAILIVHLIGLRHDGSQCRRLSRLRLEGLVVVHLGVILVLLDRSRIKTLEGKVAHALRQLVNRHLLGAPRQAELGTREPNAAALNNRRDLRALDNELLHRNTLVRAALQVIELRVPLTVALRQLDLDIRRIRQHVALLVLAVLERRGVERLDDLAIQVGLEPRLGILDTLVNHELVHLLQNTHELLDLRALLVATEGEVHRILVLTLLIGKGVEAKGRGHGDGGLHDEALAIVVQVCLLRTALQRARRREGNRLGLEAGREDNVGHCKEE